MANALETFVSSLHNNVVLRDGDGKPSIFVRHPKVNSNFFHESLPDTPHPAFVFGNDTDKGVLIGKYAASQLVSGGTLYSLPNANPITNIGYETLCARAASFQGATAMTIADYGLILLLAQKAGYRVAHGNNWNGNDKNNGKVARVWTANQNATAGTLYMYLGWVYECQVSHKMANSLLPPSTPSHWRCTGQKLGGTACYTANYDYIRTLTGSGPMNWYFLDDISNEADLMGNSRMFLTGLRIVAGEIQIVPNAGDPEADVSDSSEAWKAILPHSADDGYDLVAPGTEGTVRYVWANSTVTLVARAPESGELPGQKHVDLYNIAVESATLPYVPHILYELGLAPLNVPERQKVSSDYVIQLSNNTTAYYSLFGNHASQATPCVASLWIFAAKDAAMDPNGVRQRVREKA